MGSSNSNRVGGGVVTCTKRPPDLNGPPPRLRGLILFVSQCQTLQITAL